jgi:hypothetical protein
VRLITDHEPRTDHAPRTADHAPRTADHAPRTKKSFNKIQIYFVVQKHNKESHAFNLNRRFRFEEQNYDHRNRVMIRYASTRGSVLVSPTQPALTSSLSAAQPR